jgi:hypothetical protein
MSTPKANKAAIKTAVNTVSGLTVDTIRGPGDEIPGDKLPLVTITTREITSEPSAHVRGSAQDFYRTQALQLDLYVKYSATKELEEQLDDTTASIEAAIMATDDLADTVHNLFMQSVIYEKEDTGAVPLAHAEIEIIVEYTHTAALV